MAAHTHHKLCVLIGFVMSLAACGGGGGSAPAANTPPASNPPPADTAAPVITLTGAVTMTLVAGTAYVEPGASATDAVDGTVAVDITGTVGSSPGTYTRTYSASDAAGNTASVTRTIVVEAAPVAANPNDIRVLDGGTAAAAWDRGINAFDEATGFGECNNDGGAACPSIGWEVVSDPVRGDVLQITHSPAGNLAGVFIAASTLKDLSGFARGEIVFDIRVVSGDSNITMKLDCIFPCTSGDQHLGSKGAGGWETVAMPMATLTAGGLDLTRVNTGIVIWATNSRDTVFQLDNVRFTGFDPNAPAPTPAPPNLSYTITPYVAGSVSDTINPASFRCVVDFGNWIYNAGVVLPAIAGCDPNTGIPTGKPTPLMPQLTGAAATQPTPSHRWWGSIPFLGEMTIGDPNDAAYITPDPITARITDRGFRAMGIASGLGAAGNDFGYSIPDPFNEVFDGIAVANTEHAALEAYLKDHSDGSVTVEWQNAGQAVMEATFVHGSPYVFVQVLQGEPLLRTLRANSGEKGTFYQSATSLGVWTSVAGNHNNFLVVGEGATTFSGTTGNAITISNAANAFTLVYLPQTSGTPAATLTEYFEARARNVVARVDIDYAVDRDTNAVTISHVYRDAGGAPVTTLAGLHPLHWKRSNAPESGFKVRSARGIIKFSPTSTFSYTLPSVGVLPILPTIDGTYDRDVLAGLVREFVATGEAAWNTRTDTYWSGKDYGKVAELVAIADAIGLQPEADRLLAWLKAELADWFTAETAGTLDAIRYFVYDAEWNTLLGLEESFAAHQQLNDHHFHYGYFVRAAAEICRQDIAWCGPDQYGPMVELLIRDYAADDNDPLFPRLRNFDPANGFSWASGPQNFARGNNNESTSEAANAYGAIILYGLVTGRDDLVEKGLYLHASTAATYWEYWNNIDGYRSPGTDLDNFPPGYSRITTSIIWGDGGVFSTWFSGAFAHILGIQGLPSNPLILHVSLYADYMADYVSLGLSESANGRPSGLPDDQWRDLWWNLWAMVDAAAAIADYATVASYVPEAGESRAHTYHWLQTFRALGQVQTGTGALTANYPAALAFDNNGVTTYVVYNFAAAERIVAFSDGQTVTAAPQGFTLVTR